MGKYSKIRKLRSAMWTLCAVAVTITFCVAAAINATGTQQNSASNNEVGYYETSAAKTYTVVLDAGHGGFDGGAVGNKSGVCEAGINLNIAKEVKSLLEAKGVNVIMTRENDDALGSNKNEDMRARKRIINESNADAVISIHLNKFTDPSVYGPMSFYMKGSEEGERLSTAIIKSVCNAVGHPQRSANPGDYYVIRESPVPSAIMECGFLSNGADETKLLDESYQSLLAGAIAEGIIGFLYPQIENNTVLE